MLGFDLFTWQREAADLAGEYDPVTGRPRFRTVGISVARQNGKTTLVLVRVGRALLPARQTVVYTAQDRSLARVKWMEHVELLMDTPFARRVDRIDRQQNREMMIMKNGSVYMPVTPSTKKAGRSLSIDLALLDEAYAQTDMGVIKGLNPALITRPLAQLWMLSNAGDETSALWWHYTELGRSMVDVDDSTLCWIEYAPEGDPTTVDVHDKENWRVANPSMGEPGGVDEVALRAASQENDAATFRKEHLNLWTDRAQVEGLSERAWAECHRDDLTPGDKVAFGLDFDADRTVGALVSAGSINGVTPLEVIDVSTDFDQLVQRAAANANEFDGFVVVQAGSPAASEIPTLERLTAYGRKGKHRVKVLSQPEMARAVGSFYDAVTARRLSHRNDVRLNEDVRQVTRRKVGDVFVWGRHGPLSAATLARWGVLTAPADTKPAAGSVHSSVRQRVGSGPSLTNRRLPVRRIS
jgi:Phage Terminase